MAMAVGVGVAVGSANKIFKPALADDFDTTYDYANGPEGTDVWSISDYANQSTYYQVPSSGSSSVVTIPGIFTGKTITSNVVITINNGTYGSGTSPSSSTFAIYNSSACTTQVTAAQSGTLATSKAYVNTIYTVTLANATGANGFSTDLAILVTKPGRTIRLNSITVEFSYTEGSGSSAEVSSVSLSVTTAGGPTYDAEEESSFVVGFTTSVSYVGDEGTNKVNISVSPSTNVSGHGNNMDAGAFNLTFTKSGTYRVTSTSTEDGTKSQYVDITINNIVVPGYELVTSTSSIRNGTKIVLHSHAVVNEGQTTYDYIMTTQASGYRNVTSLVVSDNFIPTSSLPAAAEIITLVVSESHWELKTSNNKYLSLTTNDNKLFTSDAADTTNNTTEWDISFSGSNAVITSVAYPSRVIRLNGESTRFACYTGTNQAIQMYALVDTSPYFSINTTSVYLGNRGTQSLQLTAHNKASDSVTWSSSNNSVASVSPTSGLNTIVTAASSGTGVATITATFASGNYDPISVRVEVLNLDTYVNVGVTTFTKVTSEPAGGWAGTYLLVDETANVIFDGSASPLGAGSEKSISAPVNNQITATTDLIVSSFNIKASTNGFTLKSNSNYYVGNRSAENGIMMSLGVQYEVSVGATGTLTALQENGSSTSTTLRHNAASNIFRFYTGSTGNAIALYRANGEVKAISNTLTSWYDAAKSEELLVCSSSGIGSKVDLDGLEDKAIELLTSDDLDTLKKMSAKSSENGGNYLEDLISDYDYYIQYILKSPTKDFLERFGTGGANENVQFAAMPGMMAGLSLENTTATLVIIISFISTIAVGGYFLIRRRKEN